jgi:hypothetical protein
MPENVNPYDFYSGPSSVESPGGFVFGPQGWSWGEPRPRTITFFLDGTAKVSDQWGRPIKGVMTNSNKPVLFAQGPPNNDDPPSARKEYANHKQVIEALLAERIDWMSLTCAGFPQLSYEELKKLPALPPTPVKELRKIADPTLRRDALKARREADEARKRELHPDEDEE